MNRWAARDEMTAMKLVVLVGLVAMLGDAGFTAASLLGRSSEEARLFEEAASTVWKMSAGALLSARLMRHPDHGVHHDHAARRPKRQRP